MLFKLLAVALSAIFLAFVLDVAIDLGAFTTRFYKHHPGPCKAVGGIQFGAEDFKILDNGLTFISSGHGNTFCPPAYVKEKALKGRLYAFDITKPDKPAVELKMKSSQMFNRDTFAPHGLDVLEDKSKGEHLVYVVNHVHDLPDRVEKFKYLPERQELVHVKSIFSESFWSLNSLLLIEEDKFYITNYLYYRNIVFNVIEFIGRFAYGNVLYFDGTNSTIMSSGYQGPNGLVFSKDRKFLYMAVTQGKIMVVFERLPDDSLRPIQSFFLGSGGDNLQLSQDGKTLFLGYIPIKWKLLRHVGNPDAKAPAGVLALPLKADGRIEENEITELFYDHGDLISMATVGTVFNGRLMVGSLLDKMLLCDLNLSNFRQQRHKNE